jgi:hypothetical protein
LNEIVSAKIIDSVQMIGVRMGKKNGINARDFFAQGLLAKIGRGVDENSFSLGLK